MAPKRPFTPQEKQDHFPTFPDSQFSAGPASAVSPCSSKTKEESRCAGVRRC